MPDLPQITDADIDWVCGLLGLNALDDPRRDFLKNMSTVDVSACPGSGKTTLVVAKLAMLARKWPYRMHGICVLSHTNVAREEIQHRLGRTGIGQRLLGFPHFIGTIHSFANRFLALPWLYSHGFPVVAIDNEITTAYRRHSLGSDQYKLESYLNRKYSSIDRLRIAGRDLSFTLNGEAFPAGENTDNYKRAKKAVEAAALAGYFFHEEMFVWARAYLEDHPDAPTWLAERFPLVIVDEMQDTSDSQGAFIASIFPRDKVIVQRVGDPNQAIFGFDGAQANQTDPFPDPSPERCIPISTSYRFGPKIASIASPFAVEAIVPDGLCGDGPKRKELVPNQDVDTIFVFPDDCTDGVIDAYAKLVLDVFPADVLAKQRVAAVGAVHKPAPDVGPGDPHFPKCVGHYWSGYDSEQSRRASNPKTLLGYLRSAQDIVTQQNELHLGLEKLVAGFARLASHIGNAKHLAGKSLTHRRMKVILEGDQPLLEVYQRVVSKLLVNQDEQQEAQWNDACEEYIQIAAALCDGSIAKAKARDFLRWSAPEPGHQATVGLTSAVPVNVYRYTETDRYVDVQLGSIHSVKGQTHLATLILNTFSHAHMFARLLPWLLGKRANGGKVVSQDRRRLHAIYVAMTRPTGLLCLAMQRSLLNADGSYDENKARLCARGWRVTEI